MDQAIYYLNNNDENILDINDFKYNYHKGLFVSIHISDLHFPVMDPKKQYDILEKQFLQKVETVPFLNLVCINGDLYDHKVMTSSDATLYASMFISRLVEICKSKNATLIILQGTISHDANQLRIYYHYMQRTDVDVRIVTNIQFENVGNARILCIPELYGIPEEIYQNYLSYSGFYDMCIMHGTFKGSVYGDNVGNGRLFTIDDFNNCKGPIIAGHVHKPGCFSNHFYYCGSPYRWRFDDDHKKGFILVGQNLDTSIYYLDYEEIFSDVYKTFTFEELINNNPKDTIDYIDNLKNTQGINYIKIKFNNDISQSDRMSISNNYRNDNSVVLEFYSQDREIQKQAEQKMKEDQETYGFLLDKSISDEQKFVMWVNHLKNDEVYLTVDELKELLKEE